MVPHPSRFSKVDETVLINFTADGEGNLASDVDGPFIHDDGDSKTAPNHITGGIIRILCAKPILTDHAVGKCHSTNSSPADK